MSLETKLVKISNKDIQTIIPKRPTNERIIVKSSVTNVGRMRSLKKDQRDYIFQYESPLERDFYLLLDHDKNCLQFVAQPKLNITYITYKNIKSEITLDTWAMFYNSEENSIYIRLFEIKHSKQLDKLLKVYIAPEEDRLQIIEEILKNQDPNDKLKLSKSVLLNFPLRMKAIKEWVSNHPFRPLECEFMFMTEEKIRCDERLNNIKYLLKGANIFIRS